MRFAYQAYVGQLAISDKASYVKTHYPNNSSFHPSPAQTNVGVPGGRKSARYHNLIGVGFAQDRLQAMTHFPLSPTSDILSACCTPYCSDGTRTDPYFESVAAVARFRRGALHKGLLH